MLDVDTFLTALYVMVDDFCHSQPHKRRPGPKASLSDSEVITLAIFARWGRFCGERDFYRYARRRLHEAFPTLPDRSQFNRLVRSRVGLIEEVALHLALVPDTRNSACYEALDTSAMPVRDAKRRGKGWLAGYADIGWSNSLGWYEGFRLLVAVDPTGVITGFGFASASTKDQPLAETFFALRAQADPRCVLHGLRVQRGPSEPSAKGTSDGPAPAYPHACPPGRGSDRAVLPHRRRLYTAQLSWRSTLRIPQTPLGFGGHRSRPFPAASGCGE